MPGATLCGVRFPSGPLNPPRRLLMGSGPSNPEPRVLQAMLAAPIAPDDPAFAVLLNTVTDLGRTLFRTKNRCTLFCAGASRAGIEAVLASVVEPDDRVLVGVYGHFGELLCNLATRHGARVERVDAEWGEPVDVSACTIATSSGGSHRILATKSSTSTDSPHSSSTRSTLAP